MSYLNYTPDYHDENNNENKEENDYYDTKQSLNNLKWEIESDLVDIDKKINEYNNNYWWLYDFEKDEYNLKDNNDIRKLEDLYIFWTVVDFLWSVSYGENKSLWAKWDKDNDKSNNKDLKTLDLNWNYIDSYIWPKDIANIINIIYDAGKIWDLNFLSLSSLWLDTIPAEIWKLINLVSLDLSYNLSDSWHTSFPKEMTNLTNLKELNLYNSNIEWLDNICNLENLENLNVWFCHIDELPDDFWNLINLKILELTNNDLSKFPDSFFNLKKLEYLDLFDNNIDLSQYSFSSFPNLKYLDLSLNNQASLLELNSNSFSSSLQSLILINCNIKKLDISNLNLSELNLSSNPELFESNENLKISDQTIKNLKTLSLNSNNIIELPDWISKLRNIKELDLHNNWNWLHKDNNLQIDWLLNLTTLTKLDISWCWLSDEEEETLKKLKNNWIELKYSDNLMWYRL